MTSFSQVLVNAAAWTILIVGLAVCVASVAVPMYLNWARRKEEPDFWIQ